ncbi:MAG: tetratricopeptide repeat protein, partial [Cyclobacteriaceae bacterium]|nr:tetratricopeptide repeat protein [Cyclobacteriaceae bacterium]
MKTIATIIIVLGFGSLALGQNSTKVYESFIESYGLEATGNYSNAIDKIIDIYAEDSYDMNIRLGWLYYNLGNYPESEKYYQRSMEILPYSIEAKLGYVLPVSGLGYWDKVI